MTKRRRGRKVDPKTGRSTGEETHFRLHRSFGQSDVIRRLSGPELKIWIELHTRHNGFNNGRIGLSYGEAARQLEMSKTTASRAFEGLQQKGLVKLRRPGERLGRLSAEWTLTDQPMDGHPPTRDYKDWVPPPKERRHVRPKSRPVKTQRRNPALVLVRNDTAL